MHRSWLLVLSLLLISAPAVSQSTSSDSDGMQALVAEVRQLRKDLQTTNGYALRAQVLLYRLQVQEATVARVSQHLNDVRAKLAAIQEHQRQLVGTMKYYEKIAEESASTPAQQKEAEQQVSSIKTELPSVAAQEQQGKPQKWRPRSNYGPSRRNSVASKTEWTGWKRNSVAIANRGGGPSLRVCFFCISAPSRCSCEMNGGAPENCLGGQLCSTYVSARFRGGHFAGSWSKISPVQAQFDPIRSLRWWRKRRRVFLLESV